MIYTVTLNPSLDYIVSVPDFRRGRVNRTGSERMYPGGKGVNVSQVLANLGHRSVALGFLAGFTGAEIEKQLQTRGIQTAFVQVKEGMSRINIKLQTRKGAPEEAGIEETEINGAGPVVRPEELELLLGQLERLMPGDVLVLAGSIPSALPDTIYQDICRLLTGRGVHIVVDATGSLLMKVLEYRPFLIKPNHHELGELFGVELTDREEVVPYAKKLQELGAQNVLVSMGSRGAVLVAEDGKVYSSPAPKGVPGSQVKNAVGAGDSMVAGFLAGLLEEGGEIAGGAYDYREAFEMGLCTGSASAFSEELATREEVEALRAAFRA